MHPPQPIAFQLRHMDLHPDALEGPPGCLVQITVSTSQEHEHRKFLFMVEETEEESPPLTVGQHFLFQEPLADPGHYTLICLNYPKIRATIHVKTANEQQQPPQNDKERQIEAGEQARASSPLCDLTEVQQRDEEKEEGNHSNCKSDFADYERILSDQDMRYDYMPNKYLRYFKEEFKLWRDFFEQPTPAPTLTPSLPPLSKEPSREASSGSLSVQERESERAGSVISQLRSQQEMSEVQEEVDRSKIMKKTNSEYCFNPHAEKPTPSPSKRKQINTNTSSPNPKTEQSEADSFVDWAATWADQQHLAPVTIPRLGDRHLVRQWLSFLQNKFKIGEIMYG